MLRRVNGAEPADAEVAQLMAATDANDDGVISFEEFASTGFAEMRLRARLHELAERAASRVQSFHEGAPWRGELRSEAGFEAFWDGTGLDALALK